MGYKCTLLSTLIPVNYETTINTLFDLDESGLPLLMPRATDQEHAFANDNRPLLKRIYNNSILWSYTGPESLDEQLKMYLIGLKFFYPKITFSLVSELRKAKVS